MKYHLMWHFIWAFTVCQNICLLVSRIKKVKTLSLQKMSKANILMLPAEDIKWHIKSHIYAN